MMEAFAELMLLGARVREVPGLKEKSLWIPDRLLLLIDQSLTEEHRRRVSDRLLAEAADWSQTTV